MADLTTEELEYWLASVPCTMYKPLDMQRMAREIKRRRASKLALLSADDLRWIEQALAVLTSDNDVPHDDIARIRKVVLEAVGS